ncbi:uncharacterized protein LOC108867940 [Pyrus x bretschneideri]|uniref:uncharacterized protein LOC108867940 n=1 Tax=Pyrus x bretschneideri TaxID=225117 RepID=UPI00202E688B|nr:uncharacterized protein LOC108867940 [Pyrus x bretschneideri]
MIVAWIINSIDSEISDSILYMTDAHAIWEELRERFSQSNAPHIFQLQRDIVSLTQDQLSVAAYYTKLKKLWDELAPYSDSISCTCGAQNERNKLMQFLMGLNECYGAIRRQLHGYPPGHRLHKVKPQKGSKPSKKEGSSFSSVNQVSECATLEEMKSVMSGLSNNQFQQILHIMNNKGRDASVPPKANVVAMKAGLDDEDGDWFG